MYGIMADEWSKTAGRTVKKRAYHHGDLERALVETAVGMIQEEGVRR